MKKLIAALITFTLTLCVGLSFVGCGDNSNKLIVYTEAGFAPWEYTKAGSLDVVGVDMEIAKYIANKYGWTLQVVNGDFNTIVAGISEDNALGIAGITYSEDRAEKVEFSDFYWGDAYQSVVYLKSSNPDMNDDNTFAVGNFEGKRLVYQTGTTSQITVGENESAWKISGKADFSQVMAALQDVKDSGGNNYLIVDSQVAARLAANDDTLAYAAIEGVEAERYGIVAKKGNVELIQKVNAALAELLEKDSNGQNQIDKWFVQYSANAE